MNAQTILKVLAAAAAISFIADEISGGDLKTVTILQTTDIHCQIDGGDDGGGWGRLATLVNNEIALAGKNAVILVDCGDAVQGTFAGSATKGRVAVDILNQFPYDAWVPGNHEFDFGMDCLVDFLDRIQCPALAANLAFEDSNKLLKPWILVERNGVRVAIVGMTLPFLKHWLWGEQFDSVRVDDVQSAFEAVVAAVMKVNPDMIIIAAHHGLFPYDETRRNSLRQLARNHPQIDLILGGHTHQEVPGVRLGANTWYAEGGSRAGALLVVKATIDVDRHVVVKLVSKLVKTTPDVPRDPAFLERLKPELDRLEAIGDVVVGETEVPLTSFNGDRGDHRLNDLFCRAIASSSGTEAAFHSSVRRNTTVVGDVTNRDLFWMIPYENTIGVLSLTGAEIKAVAREQFNETAPWRRNTPWGVQIPVRADGSVGSGPVRKVAGSPMKPGERIDVAFANFTLAGSGGRHPVLAALAKSPRCRPRDTGVLVRDALREWFENDFR